MRANLSRQAHKDFKLPRFSVSYIFPRALTYNMDMKIVLTGGGTAGHAVPCLALLPQLKPIFSHIYYIGSEKGIERELASLENLPYFSVPTAKLVRRLTPKNLCLPFRVLDGIGKAKKLLKKLSPDVVFSKGGYVALPVALAAARLGIPVVAHESDLTPGLANRLTARYCKVICTTFERAAKSLPRAVFTGSPIREKLYRGVAERALSRAKFSRTAPVILAFGGSSGSLALNHAVRECAAVLSEFNILHICGKGNLDPDFSAPNYAQLEYAHDMENYLAAADIVLSRAGSNAVCELLALKKPMLLVPLPKGASRGDQVQNAEYFQNLGYAAVLAQSELSTARLAAELKALYSARAAYAAKMSAAPNIDGTKNVYLKILEAIGKK